MFRYVQATTIDHEFTKDWGRRMEEILILVGLVKVEELSRELVQKDRTKGEEKDRNLGKSIGAIGTLANLKDVPRHFKSYSIQDRDISCEKAKRIADTYDDGVYEGPAKVKEVNLVEPGETPKLVFVSVDLTKKEEGDLTALLCDKWYTDETHRPCDFGYSHC